MNDIPAKLLAFLLLSMLLQSGVVSYAQDQDTAEQLKHYVNSPDESFAWNIETNQMAEDFRYIVVNLTSQNWLTPELVDRVKWQHWMEIYIPNNLTSDVAFLFITGGSNAAEMPETPDSSPLQIALTTNNVVVQLSQVPNQPLTFLDDGQRRSEDDLIAFSWVQFLETRSANWIAQNAMVKSVVQAMNATTKILALDEAGNHSIDEFVVGGGSKRGWTTWLTAAVDPRVVAIVPMVFDVLNIRESMRHHFEAYGFWSSSIGDYVNHGIMRKMQSKELDPLLKIVDPFGYREHLNMPKFIVNSAGDQFFLPDSSQFYWEELQGPKYLRYVPNTDHSLGNSDAVESIAAFVSLVARQKEIPSIEWARTGVTGIEVSTSQPPLEAKLWVAHNPSSRDFRLRPSSSDNSSPYEPVYSEHSLSSIDDDNLRFMTSLEPEVPGWYAWFVELTFDVGLPVPLKLTTDVQVTPDTLPYAGKDHTKDNYVTIHCLAKPESSEVQQRVLRFLTDSVKTEDASHSTHAGRDYYVWKQYNDLRVEGTVVTRLLESLDYADCQYQLESGNGPTLPPISEQ